MNFAASASARAITDFRFSLPCVAAMCLTLTGCGGSGPPRAAVEGMVTLNGTPLKSGVIRFVPTGDPKKPLGPSAQGAIKEGAFKMSRSDGPIFGPHRIEIDATDYYGFPADDEKAYAEAHAKGAIPRSPVPDIYNTKSNLKEDVKTDGQKFDFKLQGTPTVAGTPTGTYAP